MPSAKSPLVWNGVIFLRQGLYEGCALRFTLTIPDNYPDGDCPVSHLSLSAWWVTFLCQVSHLSVSVPGESLVCACAWWVSSLCPVSDCLCLWWVTVFVCLWWVTVCLCLVSHMSLSVSVWWINVVVSVWWVNCLCLCPMTLWVTFVFACHCLDIIRYGRVIQWGKLQGVFVFSILAVTVCPIPCIGLCTVCMVRMVWMKKKNTCRCLSFIFYPVSEKFIFDGHKNTILSAAILCLAVFVVSGCKQCQHVAEVLNTSQPTSVLLFPGKEWTSMAETRAAQIQRRKSFFLWLFSEAQSWKYVVRYLCFQADWPLAFAFPLWDESVGSWKKA